MARVMLFEASDECEFFVVDKGVGMGLPNAVQDVLLVQFLLRIVSETAGGSVGFNPPGESPISIDGMFGRKTQTYISFYQNEMNRRLGPKSLLPDGRIDPVTPGERIGSISQTLYTIISLNGEYQLRRRGKKIENDPLFPKGLRTAFFL